MKKLSISVIALLTLTIGIYSCTKESSNTVVKNTLKTVTEEPIEWTKAYISKKKNKCNGCPISFGLCSPAKCDGSSSDYEMINPTDITDGTNTAYIKLTMVSSNVLRLKVDNIHSDPTTLQTIFGGSHFIVDELDEEIDEYYSNKLGFTSVRLIPGNYPIHIVNGHKVMDFNVEVN